MMRKVNDTSTRAISRFNYSLPLVWNCMIELKLLKEHFFRHAHSHMGP